MTTPETEDSKLIAAAKKIGAAAGKVAALAGVEPAAGPLLKNPPVKASKFKKTNKARLPRRAKKLQKKVAAKAAAK